MIVHDVKQGTQEWLDLHIAIPTASRFAKLVTPKTMKVSAQAKTLACELAAEWMMGECVNGVVTQYMQRGLKLEDQAIKRYEFDRDVTVQRVGFVTLDDGSAGCSPDGLVGDDGGLEIKCPGPVQHVGYMMEPDSLVDDYRAQVQGCLWVCDRQWWDACSWHPGMEPVIVRVERDEAWSYALAGAVEEVNAAVHAMLVRFGYRKETNRADTPKIATRIDDELPAASPGAA